MRFTVGDLGTLTNVRLYSVNPHMHLIGTHISATIERPAARGGDPQNECLANGNWNFDWQRTYIYDAPLDQLPSVQAGDIIDVQCTWNNTIENPFVQRALNDRGPGRAGRHLARRGRLDRRDVPRDLRHRGRRAAAADRDAPRAEHDADAAIEAAPLGVMLGGMSRLAWMVAFIGSAVFVACYNPSYRDCAIACDNPTACPSGLTCDTTMHMCTSGTSCSGVIDAPMNGGDGSGSGSGGSGSCYPFTPTNFDPCNIPGATGPLAVGSGSNSPINTASCTLYTYNSQRVCLLHYTSVRIDGTVTITGATPVIIVSDGDMTVTGTVTEAPTNMSTSGCNNPMPTDGGTVGGRRWWRWLWRQRRQRRLRGCGRRSRRRRRGRHAVPRAARARLSRRSRRQHVQQRHRWPRRLWRRCARAERARSAPDLRCGLDEWRGRRRRTVCAQQRHVDGRRRWRRWYGWLDLLEASAVTITATAQVCALGGGGGQGADLPPLNSGAPGETATVCSPARGGGASGTAGTGGTGGAIASATDGNGHDASFAGGGGGGAEGRIRIHSISPASVSPSAPVAPLPFEQ